MRNFIYRLFNLDKLAEQDRTIKIYRERNKQLEARVSELESFELKFRVTKLYVEDDEALLELFEIAESNERYAAHRQSRLTSRSIGLESLAAYGAAGAAGRTEISFRYSQSDTYRGQSVPSGKATIRGKPVSQMDEVTSRWQDHVF